MDLLLFFIIIYIVGYIIFLTGIWKLYITDFYNELYREYLLRNDYIGKYYRNHRKLVAMGMASWWPVIMILGFIFLIYKEK
jgi:hypothetical protein